jgi:thioesterase domain-containing protein
VFAWVIRASVSWSVFITSRCCCEGDRPVYGLQPHGLDGRQESLESIEAMASTYLGEIRKKQPHGPYYPSGVCIGGVLAYEIAQQLRALGAEVALPMFTIPGT